ncbi:hypothetical protein RRSWK_06456 [Rhodopirellula sp. SWK7]|nr:hypothetical protein RRSWK_06456 [Rhodopirellula sp. SWK7]
MRLRGGFRPRTLWEALELAFRMEFIYSTVMMRGPISLANETFLPKF